MKSVPSKPNADGAYLFLFFCFCVCGGEERRRRRGEIGKNLKK